MQIVRIGADDWRQYRALRLAALAESPDAFGSTLADEQTEPDDFWCIRLGNAAAATLVARQDARDVGLTVVAPAQGSDAGVYSVWVAPEARKRRVGRSLIEAAIEFAQQGGFARLLLEVGDHNVAAITLYTSLGFSPTGNTTCMPAPRSHLTEHELALALR